MFCNDECVFIIMVQGVFLNIKILKKINLIFIRIIYIFKARSKTEYHTLYEGIGIGGEKTCETLSPSIVANIQMQGFSFSLYLS